MSLYQLYASIDTMAEPTLSQFIFCLIYIISYNDKHLSIYLSILMYLYHLNVFIYFIAELTLSRLFHSIINII